MERMRFARRLSSFALAVLVALAAATPLEALACGSAAPCPMMKLMKGSAKAPCHPSGAAGMSTPMSCCANPPAAPVAPAVPSLALAPSSGPVAAGVAVAPAAPLAFAAPRADYSAVGLYTLHAVWRI